MFFVRKFISKKGNECIALIHSNGGKETYVSFDISVISRVSGLKYSELYTLTDDFIL